MLPPDKLNLIAQLQSHPGFQIFLQDQHEICEALKNELETPKEHLEFIQGQVTTYRNIFNYLDEKFKKAK